MTTRAHDPALTKEEARLRGDLIGDLAYELRLDLSGPPDRYGVEATIRFSSAEAGADTFLDCTASSLEGATLNGRALPAAAFADGRLALEGLAEANELHVRATFAYSRTGAGLHRFTDPVDGAAYCYSNLEPREAHRMYPCFDQPDLKGTFSFRVVAPEGWVVLSNSRASHEPEIGAAGEWRFETTPLISTYISAVVAGPFHGVHRTHRDIELGLWCRRSLAAYLDPDEFLEITAQGIDFFETTFDHPYVFGKYDQILVPEFNSGAMENAGCVTFNEYMVFRSKATEGQRETRAQTILHELAHMWFGDLVTMRWWDDLWLNESFATYMGHLAQDRATRFTNSWTTFCKSMKSWAAQQDQLPTTHPIVADVVDTDAARTNFDGISYAKGASAIRQLVAWVGEDAFLAGVRTYIKRYAFGNADLAAFLGAIEESSGRDLGLWSKEWLETTGVNDLRPVISLGPDDAVASLTIEQTADPEHPTLRSHRIGVAGYDDRDGRLVLAHRVEVDIAGPSTAVDAWRGEPAPSLVLVNDGDLSFATIGFDERSLTTITERLSDIDDPLARALCWNALWDMMRSGDITASAFVPLTLRHVTAETDVALVQTLLDRALTAATFYTDPANRAGALASLADAARRRAAAAPAGSDVQLQWIRTLIVAARSDAESVFLRGLLDGEEAIPGLDVDNDLRWRIVRALASLGGSEDLIDRELARDDSDSGRRWADAARAARPDPGVKEAMWARVVSEDAVPVATMCSILVGQPFVSSIDPLRRTIHFGLLPLEHADLARPFIRRFLDAVPGVMDRRESEAALKLVAGAFPLAAAGGELVDALDSTLAGDTVAGPIRRILLEGRDHVRRAIHLRGVDAAAREGAE